MKWKIQKHNIKTDYLSSGESNPKSCLHQLFKNVQKILLHKINIFFGYVDYNQKNDQIDNSPNE
jgi:hypothetical protein